MTISDLDKKVKGMYMMPMYIIPIYKYSRNDATGRVKDYIGIIADINGRWFNPIIDGMIHWGMLHVNIILSSIKECGHIEVTPREVTVYDIDVAKGRRVKP